ncbi:MAG: hypothetical protein HYY03_07450 [Chloroflexi bacterium]|nr:hypothetical protein [Chloroflexota bacterium]
MKTLARILMYTTMLAALGVTIFLAVRVATQDDASPTGVVEATTRQLWESPEAFEGRTVRTDGILRVFSEGTADEHYVVEQEGQYRVGVRGPSVEELRPLVGREVAVEGVLRFAEDFGVFIEAREVVEGGG